MSNSSFDFLQSKFEITKDVFVILKNLATQRILKKGEKVIEQGGLSSKVYFLTSGLMISKRVNKSGKEFTKNIYSPISFAGPFSSILTQKPSLLSYETLTECVVYEIEFTEFIE